MRLNTLNLILICILLGSCDNYYFNNPQPVNTKNTYTVPGKYRGIWQADKDGSTTITIGKDFYYITEKGQEMESKAEIDADSDLYFLKNKIYYTEDGHLKGGYNYETKGDSVLIEILETNRVDFGQNAFLRKFEYGYILNERHPDMDDWWRIYFVDTRVKNEIAIRDINKKDLEKRDNYSILHEDFSDYLIADWTKDDIQKFIDEGGFTDTIYHLKHRRKLKNQ